MQKSAEATVSMTPRRLFHLSGGRGGWQGCRFAQEPKGKLKKKQFLDLPMAEPPWNIDPESFHRAQAVCFQDTKNARGPWMLVSAPDLWMFPVPGQGKPRMISGMEAKDGEAKRVEMKT